MADFLQLVATLREQMNAELTRTDALRPLVWPVAGLLLTLSVALTAGAEKWLLILLTIALGIMLVAYLVGYTYFALRDPDSLRSEKYKLQKMAIEHGLLGDSLMGLKRIEENPQAKIIDAEPAKGLPND
jgi:hypothetical protein